MVHKNAVRIVFPVIFIVLLALFFYLKNKSDNVALQIDENIRVDCPLHSQSCRINLSDGVKLDIKLSPSGLPAMKPLTLEVKSDQIDLLKVTNFEASFKGQDMEMGHHSLTLSSSNSNLLLAEGLIPLCPMDPKMVWVLNVQFEYQNKGTVLTFSIPSNSH